MVILWVTAYILFALTSTVGGSCAPERWGPTCEETCHCMVRSSSECRPSDGHCLSGGCSRGYTGTPVCQTSCAPGQFGLACSSSCHCPPGDACNPVNGLCASGQCLQGYTSAGCQIRLPIFSSPPNVTQVLRDKITLSWRPWSPMLDPGDGPVARYDLQVKRERANWVTYDVFDVSLPEPALYTCAVTGRTPRRKYKFRLALARSDDGKVGDSYPGPSTGEVTACSSPSKAVSGLFSTQLPQGPGVVTIELKWKVPDPSTSGCSSIMYHRVTLRCENEGCPTQMMSVAMPDVTATFTRVRSDVKKYLEVVPVNDAGQLGLGDSISTVALMARGSPKSSPLPLPTLANLPLQTVANSLLPTSLTPPTSIRKLHEGSKSTSSLVCLVRTETSFELSWPDIGASKYEVILKITASYSVFPPLAGQVQQNISLDRTYLTVHHLHAATQYDVSVKPYMGDVVYMLPVWTHPLQPPAPPNPAILRVTNQTAILYIKPLTITTGPLTAYQIVMENTPGESHQAHTVRKRSDYLDERVFITKNYSDAQNEDLTYYVTAKLTGSSINLGINFTIGDNMTYNGYLNVPLKENTRYTVWIGLISMLDGINRLTYVNVEGNAADGSTFSTLLTNHTQNFDHLEFSNSSSTGLAVGLLFLLLFILLLCFWKKREWMLKCYSYSWDLNQGQSMHVAADTMDLHRKGLRIRARTYEGGMGDYDPQKKSRSQLISVQEFAKNFHNIDRNKLAKEFQKLPHGLTSTACIATSVRNQHLNRNIKVVPYDFNRLHLAMRYKSENDYINATLLRTSTDNTYIITQAPLPVTIPHFWKMVWDNRIARIVMLFDPDKENPGDEQSPKYWPAEGESQRHGKFEVKLVKEDKFAYYTVRSFELSNSSHDEILCIQHFQYCCWVSGPDVPAINSGVITFLEFMKRSQRNIDLSDTCVVHCQTGSGRSGMFLAIEILLQQVRECEQIDIQKCVAFLRQERVGLVNTLRQYHFIHSALHSALSYKKSTLSRRTFTTYFDNLIYFAQGRKTYMQKEFECMVGMTPNQQVEDPCFQSPPKTVLSTSKLQVPQREPTLASIRTDSYREKGFYVAIEHPTEQTAGSLWGIVYGIGCSSIVLFSDPDDSIYPFVPDCGQKCQHGNLIVHHAFSINHSELLLERKLLLRPASSEAKQLDVTLFQLYWRHDKPTPDVHAMLNLRMQLGKQSNPGRVAVISGSDISRTGLFFSTAVLLDKMETEGEVNIFQAALHLRSQIPHAMSTELQYHFCYLVVREYLRQTDPNQTANLKGTSQTHLQKNPYTSTPNSTSSLKRPTQIRLPMKDSMSQTKKSALKKVTADAVRKQLVTFTSSAATNESEISSKGAKVWTTYGDRVVSPNCEKHLLVKTANPGANWQHVNETASKETTPSRYASPKQCTHEVGTGDRQGLCSVVCIYSSENYWQNHLKNMDNIHRQQGACGDMPGKQFSPAPKSPNGIFTPMQECSLHQSFKFEGTERSSPIKAKHLISPIAHKAMAPKPPLLTLDIVALMRDVGMSPGKERPVSVASTSATDNFQGQSKQARRLERLKQIGKSLPHIGGQWQ